MKALIFAASMLAATPAAAVPVFGVGLETCGKWTSTKDDDAHRLGQFGWVGGFLTGFNMGAVANRTGKVDVYAAVAWIDQRCAAKPLQDVNTTALQLIIELNPK